MSISPLDQLAPRPESIDCESSQPETTSFRRTQRAPKSCVQCTKRKIKCSRTVPCSQCVGRSEGAKCRRELVLVKGKEVQGGDQDILEGQPVTVESLMEENRELKRQLAKLSEREHSRPEQESRREAQDLHRNHEAIFKESSRIKPPKTPANDLEKMAEIMMLLEMGRSRENNQSATSSSDFPQSQIATQSGLPQLAIPPSLPGYIPIEISTRLATYAVMTVAPLYGTIHGPTFLREHNRYIESRDSVDPLHMGAPWLAFYYSQLALALHHIPEDVIINWGLQDRRTLVKLWFDTSLQLLWWSDYMSTPNIMSLHTICALACLVHIYGTPLFGTTLVAAGVRIAQTLRIDHLEEEPMCQADSTISDTPCSSHGIGMVHFDVSQHLLDRETRRRLWWFILYRDWLTLPTGFPYAVAAECLQAPDPINLSGHHLSSNGPVVLPPCSIPTTASFHIARTRIARITHRFFIAYRPLPRDDSKRWKLVLDTDMALSTVLDDMPFFNDEYYDISRHQDLATWLPVARNLVLSLVNHKRLLLFRDHFAMAFSNSAYNHARNECVDRALAIVRISRQRPSTSIKTPEITSHCLAAVNVLALDLVYTPASRQWGLHDRAARALEIGNIISDIKVSESLDHNTSKIIGQVESLLYLDDFLRQSNNTSRNECNHMPENALNEEEPFELPLADDMYSNLFLDLSSDDYLNTDNNLWQ